MHMHMHMHIHTYIHTCTAPQAAEGSLPYMAVTVQKKQPMGKRDDVEVCVCGWGGEGVGGGGRC
jgi:hypothetical protein